MNNWGENWYGHEDDRENVPDAHGDRNRKQATCSSKTERGRIPLFRKSSASSLCTLASGRPEGSQGRGA